MAGIEHIEAWVCIAVAVVFALVALITAGRRKVLPGLVLSVTLLAAGPYLHDGHYPGWLGWLFMVYCASLACYLILGIVSAAKAGLRSWRF